MKFYFHPEAYAEFDKAVEYYEECQSGPGLEFAEEVYVTITSIVAYPDAWSPLSKNTRRCLTNRFPYGVIYQVKTSDIQLFFGDLEGHFLHLKNNISDFEFPRESF